MVYTGTCRRHLEASRLPGLVVVCAGCASSAALLLALAPLYFPRSAREADAARWRLPDLSDALHDRRIRIIHNPHSHNSDTSKFLTLFLLTPMSVTKSPK